jgi:hypothetical protein
VAGDVVLYPKYQMLVANQESLARLSDEQRAAFDAIVDEAHRLALGRHFTEAELAAGICEIGGRVVEAGPEAVEALKAAAAPLSDEMATDPVMGPIIDRITALAEQTPRGPGAGSCEPAAATGPDTATDTLVSEQDLAGYTGTELPPSGTYRAEMEREALAAAGAGGNYAAINDGIWTWTFAGDTWQAHHDRNDERCSGTAELADGNVRVLTVVSQGCGMDYELRWRLDGDKLSLRLADLPWTYTDTDFANEQIFIDRVWTRIEEPTSSAAAAAIPVGTYRTEITVQDLESRGVDHENAVQNAGIVTWAIDGGDSVLRWESGATAGYVCPMIGTPVDAAVRFDMPSSDCDPGAYTMTLDVSGDQLRPTVVSTEPARDHALVKAFFERPWTKID